MDRFFTCPASRLPLSGRPGRSSATWVLGFAMMTTGLIIAAWWFDGLSAWSRLTRTSQLADFELIAIDRGSVSVQVIESGSLESSRSTVVTCQVEAMLGVMSESGTQAGSGLSSSTGTMSGSGSASTTSTSTTQSASTSTATAAASPATVANSSTTLAVRKPRIDSFSFRVPKYVSMGSSRSGGGSSASGTTRSTAPTAGGGGFGMEEEGSGSTWILSIIPEGTEVQAGQVVCELDSSALREELEIQLIRIDQATATVEQAQNNLDVAKIDLVQYRDGILPSDRLAIQSYLEECLTIYDQARRNVEWAREAFQKGLLTKPQFRAEELGRTQIELAIGEGRKMSERLETLTAPKLLKELQARIDAAQTDLETQRLALDRELSRRDRLQKNIDACTLRAPHQGVVIYVKRTSRWSGQIREQIEQGQFVRERQPIFELPDFSRFRVSVRVNETQIGRLRVGQEAHVEVSALPELKLTGTVTWINVLTEDDGLNEDVRSFEVHVDLDQDAAELGVLPGMSTRVAFQVARANDVVRVPMASLKWFSGIPYVAIPTATEQGYRWQNLELGLQDPLFAEVRSGLDLGQQIIGNPEDLPNPPVLQASIEQTDHPKLLSMQER